MRDWGAMPNSHFFGIVHFKHPHPRYPKMLWQADVVQRCACLERHAKTPHFLTLRSASIPILGIQQHFCGQIWCRGMRACSTTPKHHIFWHCAVQTPNYKYSKSLLRAEVCALGAPRQNPYFLALHISNTPILGILNICAGRFGAEVCALGAPRQKNTFFGIAQCKPPLTRYPKNTFAGRFGAEVCALGVPRQKPVFLALRISNNPVLGIQKHSSRQIWCRGMRAWSTTLKKSIFWHCAVQTSPHLSGI